MINSENLINDGLDMTTCLNNGIVPFSYNQGIILSGLAELTWATGLDSYNELANTLALSSIPAITVNGILHESCEPNCSGDEQQFKGVLGRNIQFLVNRADVLPDSTRATYVNILQTSADAIWADDQVNNQLGLIWSGPDGQTATVQTQGSALDAIVGAACVT